MPIDPRTMTALRKKGMTLEYQPETGASREVPETSTASQFFAGIDPERRANHASYHRMLEVAKDKGEKPAVELVTCKRVIDDKTKAEYALFTFRISTTHYDGTTILSEVWSDFGKWYEPTWKRIFDGKKNRWEESDQVSGSITHYDYPWSPKLKIKTPLDDKPVPLESLLTPETRFYVVNKGIKNIVRKEDWLSMQRDQIIDTYCRGNQQATTLQALSDALTKAQLLTGSGNNA